MSTGFGLVLVGFGPVLKHMLTNISASSAPIGCDDASRPFCGAVTVLPYGRWRDVSVPQCPLVCFPDISECLKSYMMEAFLARWLLGHAVRPCLREPA